MLQNAFGQFPFKPDLQLLLKTNMTFTKRWWFTQSSANHMILHPERHLLQGLKLKQISISMISLRTLQSLRPPLGCNCNWPSIERLLCSYSTWGILSKGNSSYKSSTANDLLAASRVFDNSIAIVMGPTPPGTGVIIEATSEASL